MQSNPCFPHRAKLLIFVLVLVLRVPRALADNVPVGAYPYDSDYADINAPVVGIAGFNGNSFFTPGAGVPIDTFNVSLALGTFTQQYPGVVFSIDSGFAEVSTIVSDLDSNGIDFGDSVLSNLGPGTFSFRQGGVLVIGGSFLTATFTGQIGGSGGGAISSDTGSLDLFPGTAFDFDNGTFVSQILDPEAFAINLTSIPAPGVQATQIANFGVFIVADLQPFGLSNGSVNTSGIAVVIPEPSSAILLTMGGLMCAWNVRRRQRALARH